LSGATHPSFAPDGIRVAAWDGCTLVVVDKDGANRKELLDCPFSGFADQGLSPQAWLTSGTNFLFHINPSVVVGPQQIFYVEADSDQSTIIVGAESGRGAWDAAQSPGSLVMFTSDKSGNRQLWMYDHMSKENWQFTLDNESEYYDPVWSPSLSSRKIAFVSTRDGNPEVYTYDLDTTQTFRLTNSSEEEANPYWVP
jgi:Tol biopolymer transport system component